MTQIKKNPAFLNEPQLLSEMQRKDPFIALEEFFRVYKLYQAKSIVTDLFHVAVSTENYQFGTALERAGAVSFQEHIQMLLEAAYLLKENKAEIIRKPPPKRKSGGNR